MKWLIIKMLEIVIKKCEKRKKLLEIEGGGSAIVAQAYGNMIKNYKNSIMFLNLLKKNVNY